MWYTNTIEWGDWLMQERTQLDQIKESLEGYVGRKVQLTAKRGRKKRIVKRGIIENTYPSIFVIKLDREEDETAERRMTFSYTDVLTRSVEVVVFKNTQKGA